MARYLYKNAGHELVHLVNVASTIENITKLPTILPLIVRESYYIAGFCAGNGESDEVRSQLLLSTARMLVLLPLLQQRIGMTIECSKRLPIPEDQTYRCNWARYLREADQYQLTESARWSLLKAMISHFVYELVSLQLAYSTKMTTLLIDTLVRPKIHDLNPGQKFAILSTTYTFMDSQGQVYPVK